MKRRTHALLLWAAATDETFSPTTVDGDPVLAGKCIHCQRVVCVPLSPEGPVGGTVEHIRPRHHGGGDELPNLAVACPGCNAGKGVRLDHRPETDATLQRVIATLRERRAARWRTPPAHIRLPPFPGPSGDDRP